MRLHLRGLKQLNILLLIPTLLLPTHLQFLTPIQIATLHLILLILFLGHEL